jgi:Fe-S cluster biogenesis protein NfuA
MAAARRNMVLGETASLAFPGLLFTALAPGRAFVASEVETAFPAAKAHRVRQQQLPAPPPGECAAGECAAGGRLHVVVTFQRVTPSLIDYSAEAAEWKDTSRDVFVDFQAALGEQLRAAAQEHGGGAAAVWCDAADPVTGLALSGECGPSTYTESDAIEQLLAYELLHVGTAGGGCRMVQHPRFGVDVYPATAFAFCETSVLLQALSRM